MVCWPWPRVLEGSWLNVVQGDIVFFLGCQCCGLPVELDWFSSINVVNFWEPEVAIFEAILPLSMMNKSSDSGCCSVCVFISLTEG